MPSPHLALARSILVLGAVLAAACAPPRCPEAPPAVPPKEAAAAPAPGTPPGPRLSIAIRPEPGAPSVEVEVHALADPEALATFSFAPPGGPAALHLKSVRDDQGS